MKLSDILGYTETQVIHMALAKLAREVIPAYEADEGDLTAYSTETGHPVHGKVDSRSVATRGLCFYSESCFWVKLFLRFRIDSPVSVS